MFGFYKSRRTEISGFQKAFVLSDILPTLIGNSENTFNIIPKPKRDVFNLFNSFSLFLQFVERIFSVVKNLRPMTEIYLVYVGRFVRNNDKLPSGSRVLRDISGTDLKKK